MVREGAALGLILSGGVGYWNYRERIRKQFLRGEAHYRMGQQMQNCTPWKQLYFSWYRMPEEEFTVYHRFKPYYMMGQIDHSKEILIPKKKDGADGYEVLNPLYCYEGGKVSFKDMFAEADPVKVERAGIVISRGWIPSSLKDKRSRPTEVNTRKLTQVKGCWRAGKDIHDYKIPNNPDNNEWHNIALEDIGIYWDLPNFDEQKFYYFQLIDFDGEGKN